MHVEEYRCEYIAHALEKRLNSNYAFFSEEKIKIKILHDTAYIQND